MRNMMVRAAEVRESEQQQIFDALDEIHARLAPVESLGAVRKRMSELPDRTEVSVLAERLDEALAKLESQEGAVADLGRSVESVVDKLAKPFAQLDGRLDGVAGRFEGVAGRMDGLEDKLSSIHKRIDDLDVHLDKQDTKVDALPREIHVPLRERIDLLETTLRSRVDEVGEGVHEHLDGTREALYRSVAETTESLGKQVTSSVESGRDALRGRLDEVQKAVDGKLDQHTESLRDGLTEARDLLRSGIEGARDNVRELIGETHAALDPADRLESLADRLEQVTSRLDSMAARLDAVESGIGGRLGELTGTVEQGLHQVRGTISSRPDSDSVAAMIQSAHTDSERHNAGQLDEAMATFAELILGGGAPTPPPPTALPRQQRRARGPKPKTNGKELELEADHLAEGA
ncbi:MAG TPA: hypothetical protein VHW44_27405 [Pseudonocardiaceae bacterium]|nr:hypothetical protein [Pseudonocardiaceae bacterium]